MHGLNIDVVIASECGNLDAATFSPPEDEGIYAFIENIPDDEVIYDELVLIKSVSLIFLLLFDCFYFYSFKAKMFFIHIYSSCSVKNLFV